MTTTHTKGSSGKMLALWFCAGLVGATAIMTQPVNAEDNGRNNQRERQHMAPKRHDNRGNHYGRRNNHRYEQRCTTRAERKWDMMWGEYRTHYVRHCW